MNFGEAINAMKKDGKAVQREGWNGKNMFLYYIPEGNYTPCTDVAKLLTREDGKVKYGAYVAIKNAQGDVVPWLPSQTDMLADDWKLLNYPSMTLKNDDNGNIVEVEFKGFVNGSPLEFIYDLKNCIKQIPEDKSTILEEDYFKTIFVDYPKENGISLSNTFIYNGEDLIATGISFEDLSNIK